MTSVYTRRLSDPKCPTCNDLYKNENPVKRVGALNFIHEMNTAKRKTRKLYIKSKANMEMSNKAIQREDWDLFLKLNDQYAAMQDEISKINLIHLEKTTDRRN